MRLRHVYSELSEQLGANSTFLMHVRSFVGLAMRRKEGVLMRCGTSEHRSATGRQGSLMFVAPALGEAARRPGPDGALPLSQLEGVNIHATLVTKCSQTKQATGSEGLSNHGGSIGTLPFRTGGKISWNYQPVIRTGRGDQKGATIAGTSGLDEAWRTENGDAMWQFRDGELIFVRSYRGGAMRLIIAVKQDGPNLGCVATNVFAREGDKRDLIINSPIDGTPIAILSWKQVSSNCEVTSPSTGFDGFWQTTVVCEKQGNVDRWSYQFIGQVKNNLYHGDVGQEAKDRAGPLTTERSNEMEVSK